MNAIFADAYFFLAVLNARDQGHAHAVLAYRQNDRPILTTEYVLIETANSLSSVSGRLIFSQFIKSIQLDHRFLAVASDPQLYRNGLEYFTRMHDKEWSLTDCISFVVMKERGITEALTGDHHFAQAGFTILL